MARSRAISEIERLIRQRASEQPDDAWLDFNGQTYTWREVLSFCQRTANGFLEIGIRPGDHVGIMGVNKPEFLWAYFGLVFIGVRTVPINKWQRGAALEHMLRDSRSVALIIDDDLRGITLVLAASGVFN